MHLCIMLYTYWTPLEEKANQTVSTKQMQMLPTQARPNNVVLSSWRNFYTIYVDTYDVACMIAYVRGPMSHPQLIIIVQVFSYTFRVSGSIQRLNLRMFLSRENGRTSKMPRVRRLIPKLKIRKDIWGVAKCRKLERTTN